MRTLSARLLFAVAFCVMLGGCSGSQLAQQATQPATAIDGSDAFASETPGEEASASLDTKLLGNNPNDDVSLGKKFFRDGDFGLAEKHFRHAVELHPLAAEAWLGLAASYDRLRRFDLADRAYVQTLRLIGPTVEVLNNQGYSFMLRGNYPEARKKLIAADRLSPDNPYVRANVQLLANATRSKKPPD